MISCMMDYSWRSVGGVGLNQSNWDICAPRFWTTPFRSGDVCSVVYICIRSIYLIQIWIHDPGKPKCNLTVFPGMYVSGVKYVYEKKKFKVDLQRYMCMYKYFTYKFQYRWIAEVVRVQLPPWPCMTPTGIDQIGTVGTWWTSSLLLTHVELQSYAHLYLNMLTQCSKSWYPRKRQIVESVCFWVNVYILCTNKPSSILKY